MEKEALRPIGTVFEQRFRPDMNSTGMTCMIGTYRVAKHEQVHVAGIHSPLTWAESLDVVSTRRIKPISFELRSDASIVVYEDGSKYSFGDHWVNS